MTYLLGIALTFEERVVFGAVIGPAAASVLSFAASLLVRDVTAVTVMVGLVAAAVIGAVAVYIAGPRVAADWTDARLRWLSPLDWRRHPWPLLVVLVVCGVWSVHFFHQAYVYTPQGLYAGYVNIWGDWAAHLSFAGSFAYGHNFPPEFPIDTGHHLGYPFMIDFFAADLVPQRSTLFGFSLALILLVVVWVATREKLGARPFLVAGLLAGTLPIFHVHAYGTVVVLGAIWSLFARRREWLAFFVPALVIGVPILAWMWPPDNTSICASLPAIHGYCVEPGWLSFTDWQLYGVWLFIPEWVAFWLWNTSLLLPLIVAGHFLPRWFPTAFPKWFAPMWLWFLVPNFIVLQPWVWDNTKFFTFWALLGSVVVGGVLAGMLKHRPATAAAAVAMLVVLCLSGLLDVSRASDFKASANLFTDAGGLKVADWVRHNTSPTALFVVADEHNSPIPTLAGRRELVGYPGWLWTYGLADYLKKGEDDKRILDGDPATPELVR